MFDIGFAELIIIGVVALLVIGPERLPETIRTASAWLNRIRRSFNDIKREVQQELHNDAVMRELRDTGEQFRRETEKLGRETQQIGRDIDETSARLRETASAHPPEQAGDSTQRPDQ